MTFEFWFMFPVAIIVATVAMASGVGGATFFAPILILALRFPPEIAIGVGLMTEVFGFMSGLTAYARKRLIDYRLGAGLLIVTIPMALAGSWVSNAIESNILKTILGVGLFIVAFSFLRTPEKKDTRIPDKDAAVGAKDHQEETCIVSAEGERICYTVCHKTEGRILAGIGGLFVGLISTGLGEMNGYFLLKRCRVPAKVAVATSVFVVALTALSGAAGHLFQFMRSGEDTLSLVAKVVIFTVPGVIIGAQLGAALSGRISQRILERSLGVLFVIIAVLTLVEVYFK